MDPHLQSENAHLQSDDVQLQSDDALARLALRRECPCCGRVVDAPSYDIGSGLEFCCPSCETCWGAYGQRLDPSDPLHVPRAVIEQMPEWARPSFIPTD